MLGYRVRYTTSADVLARPDGRRWRTRRCRGGCAYYAEFDLLILDEFGFDRIERLESRQAASLLYKLIDARSPERSTALVTNIDFEAWGDYLGDPPLAMAFLDRIVDGAIILKINGKSYRAHRARPTPPGSSRRADPQRQEPLKPYQRARRQPTRAPIRPRPRPGGKTFQPGP